ncbi:MAG: hypothetical protein CVU54_01965 [Deltaproteobacteria bacterium HGW-Deltaproteobacteria-12]|nr:MAG: hypothetical protein CVU54_01965 [Deltaproteobacteria bacterium HGW-Deltaproteobacteria-12]
MAEKGARTQLEPVARQMFIDGQSLTAIETALGVSRQTLSVWKAQTRKPSEEFDEWDKARARKASFGLRMEALLERELTYAEEKQPGAIDGSTMDSLTKLGSLVVKLKTAENAGLFRDKVNAAAAEVAKAVKSGGMSDADAKVIKDKILGIL